MMWGRRKATKEVVASRRTTFVKKRVGMRDITAVRARTVSLSRPGTACNFVWSFVALRRREYMT